MGFSRYGTAKYGINIYRGYPDIEFEFNKDSKRVEFKKDMDTEFERAYMRTEFYKREK